jgi:hypothetical protein
VNAARRSALLWIVLLSLGCKRDDRTLLQSAEFGVFYGGQIQERDELPFVMDESKQQQGFRLVLREPLGEPLDVRWELSRPGPISRAGVPRPDDRITQLGEATLPRGERSFEKRFQFSPGDPLGLWNIRVTAGTHLAIDRPFTVYDAAQRRQKKRASRGADAGK